MIWNECQGEQHIRSISGILFRLAENQEQVATRSYVDTLDEQALLEDMLERVKPDYPEDISNLHYLLKSPFRYPPLSYGSRFGRTNEPSIFYGAASVKTTLFEIAYYRFLFIHSIQGATPDESISSQHTIFSINYRSKNGVQLQNPPFNAHAEKLREPVNYSYTQELGSAMRNADVDVFEYESARDPDHGICIGLFNSSPFIGEQPNEMSAWFCEVSLTIVAFKRMDSRDVFSFPVEYFLVNDELPIPAN